jgi:hydroxypyruvate reductase
MAAVAGACGADTLARAAALGLKPAEFLDRNDAYSFFSALGDLVITGPRGPTDDFRAVLIEIGDSGWGRGQ